MAFIATEEIISYDHGLSQSYPLTVLVIMLPQAVIFDMDGLLIDTEKVSMATFQDTCHSYQAAHLAGQYHQLIGRNQTEQQAIFADILPDHIDIQRFDKDWRDLFLDQLRYHVPLKPHARMLCQWLKSVSLPMAVATSTQTAKAEAFLERAGLYEFMDAVIGGDQVQHGKPAPDLYIKAADAIACPPGHALAFEDTYQGIEAAHAAGIAVVHIPDLMPANDFTRQHAVLIADNLSMAAKQLGWPLENMDAKAK
ncbi:MAG TPA: phosphatase [Alphaproteobacteria bacterium]|nr:phosphatase [Alphaproteobacteria bacterium]